MFPRALTDARDDPSSGKVAEGSAADGGTPDDDGGEGPGAAEVSEPTEKPAWLRDTPFWALSALLHLVLFAVFLSIVQELPEEARDLVELQVRSSPPKPRPLDPTLKLDLKRTLKILAPKKAEPLVTHQVQEITADIPRGVDLDRISDLNLDRNFHVGIGVGGGNAGAFGNRRPKLGLAIGGGGSETESAVLAGLLWLARHQAPDGSWRAADFTRSCKKGPCKNADPARYGDGRGYPDNDIGVTGLAMLAFAGWGHTHRDGSHPEFVECQRKAVRFLKGVQVRSLDPSTHGRFGPGDAEQWIYGHAIATMAMAELLVMSQDTILLRASVGDAVRLCLRARNEGFGWRYGIRPQSNDTSVTGWMVLALKTAKYARLGIPASEFEEAFQGARTWFHRATAANGRTGYMAPGDEGSRLLRGHPEPYPFSKEPSCMTAVAVLCRLFSGESRKSDAIRSGVRLLMEHVPRWQEAKGRSLSTINFYTWYYASYALFQFGGRDWERWNEAMKRALLAGQRKDPDLCEFGSWDPVDEWGPAGGRVYATALACMTLEVYYRFERLQGGLQF